MRLLLLALFAFSCSSAEDSGSSPPTRTGQESATLADQEIECAGDGGAVIIDPREGVPYVMECSPVSQSCGLSVDWRLGESLIVPCTPGDTVSVTWL